MLRLVVVTRSQMAKDLDLALLPSDSQAKVRASGSDLSGHRPLLQRRVLEPRHVLV